MVVGRQSLLHRQAERVIATEADSACGGACTGWVATGTKARRCCPQVRVKSEAEGEKQIRFILIFALVYSVFVNSPKNFTIFSINRAYVVVILL